MDWGIRLGLMVCTGIFICIIILLLWRLLFSLRWGVQVSSYTTVISIDVITESVETRKGFCGPPTAEIAADLKWIHVSVEESYITNVICDSFTTKFEARRPGQSSRPTIVNSRLVGENTRHCSCIILGRARARMHDKNRVWHLHASWVWVSEQLSISSSTHRATSLF